MAREWLAVYVAIITKPAYRRLSPEAKGGLLHVLVHAALTTPEATWSSPGDLADILDLDGFPKDVMRELVEHRWLVKGDDGTVQVRDWDQWQLASSKEIQRAYEASRKSDWRRTKAAKGGAEPLSPHTPLSPSQDRTSHDRTEQYIGPGPVPDTTGTTNDSEKATEPTRGIGETDCPKCGDGPLQEFLAGGALNQEVGRDRLGHLAHRTCPTAAFRRSPEGRADLEHRRSEILSTLAGGAPHAATIPDWRAS